MLKIIEVTEGKIILQLKCNVVIVLATMYFHYLFLAHLIRRMQMCYWYQKLEICVSFGSGSRADREQILKSCD